MVVNEWQQTCLAEMGVPIWSSRAASLGIWLSGPEQSIEEMQLLGAILQFLKLPFTAVRWLQKEDDIIEHPYVWWLGGGEGVHVMTSGKTVLLKTVSLAGFLADPLLKRQLFHVFSTWSV